MPLALYHGTAQLLHWASGLSSNIVAWRGSVRVFALHGCYIQETALDLNDKLAYFAPRWWNFFPRSKGPKGENVMVESSLWSWPQEAPKLCRPSCRALSKAGEEELRRKRGGGKKGRRDSTVPLCQSQPFSKGSTGPAEGKNFWGGQQ